MKIPESFQPPRRILLGPGPSEVPPLVLQAMARPTVGHLDPSFLGLMDEVRAMLRAVGEGDYPLTMPMSGTGSFGMETCVVNAVEAGDRVVVGVHGVFGGRLAEVARRAGGDVVEVHAEWGRALDPEAMRKAVLTHAPKVVALVQAETSTGVFLDLSPYRAMCDEVGALLLVDAVTSLGGVSVGLERHGIDLMYSGTQKCLSCPPGLAPIAVSPRADEVLAKRKARVQSWYADLSLIRDYWGQSRAYHHTAPINQLYGLHEALRLVLLEGLEARFARHREVSARLCRGLEALGLELLVEPGDRLPPLTTVKVPDGIGPVAEARVRQALLEGYGIEIGGGLGPLKGRVWRIGLMGHGATRVNAQVVIGALSATMRQLGHAASVDLVEALAAMG